MEQSIKGEIIRIMPEEKVTDKLTKREFVIKSEGNYPKEVCFQLINSKTDLLDSFREGETLEVFYEPSSREYNGKWYTQLNAWKIQKQAYNQTSNPTGETPYSPF